MDNFGLLEEDALVTNKWGKKIKGATHFLGITRFT